ncbi:YneF family protein [Priestia filamentosa]|uniref:YneF family protein n=1 Tax=Priestia filamentosa TaxID=1402861 RepID=UPI00058964A7
MSFLKEVYTVAVTIIVGIVSFILGAIAGFFVARGTIKQYLKKNPPFNEEMLRMMMMQMGQKPSQKKINQIMKSMNKSIS